MIFQKLLKSGFNKTKEKLQTTKAKIKGRIKINQLGKELARSGRLEKVRNKYRPDSEVVKIAEKEKIKMQFEKKDRLKRIKDKYKNRYSGSKKNIDYFGNSKKNKSLLNVKLNTGYGFGNSKKNKNRLI